MILLGYVGCLVWCRMTNPVGRVVARTTEFFSRVDVSDIQESTV